MTSRRKSGAQPKFTPDEDKRLLELVSMLGEDNWTLISKRFKNKTPKQCRSRYRNYVNPNLQHGEWTKEEDDLLKEKYYEFGPKWTIMEQIFKTRSANDIRYRWVRLSTEKAEKNICDTPPIQESKPRVRFPPIETIQFQEHSNFNFAPLLFNLRPEFGMIDDIHGKLASIH